MQIIYMGKSKLLRVGTTLKHLELKNGLDKKSLPHSQTPNLDRACP